MTPSFLQLMLLFLLYSFLGWCSEVVFAAATYGKFVNRGFLNGPVCPIYGYGILMVALLLRPLEHNLPLLFLGSAILTSAVEFLVGFLGEKILKVRLWDYRSNPFNLCGYVCLKFSLLWGLACVFILKLVHPAVADLMIKIPTGIGIVLVSVFYAVFLADILVTMIEALKLPKRICAIDELERRIRVASDRLGENLSGNTLNLKAKGERGREELDEKYHQEIEALRLRYGRLVGQKNYVHNRLIAAFPALRKGEHSTIIETIQNYERKKRE
ncbi:MAG: putative ABC transporter permease [Oscillospiraceae bacterium]|nr:putative ABC transporter permease [Oscillospiraceae bacterium]